MFVLQLIEVTKLRSLQDLGNFSMDGNPMALMEHSQQFVIFQLRSLKKLDGKEITEDDRLMADERFAQGKYFFVHLQLFFHTLHTCSTVNPLLSPHLNMPSLSNTPSLFRGRKLISLPLFKAPLPLPYYYSLIDDGLWVLVNHDCKTLSGLILDGLFTS